MTQTFPATYYPASGHPIPATLFISPVTITVRHRNEEGTEQDLHWLTDDLIAFDEQPTQLTLQYRNKQGATERLTIQDAAAVQELKKNLRRHRLVAKAPARLLGNVWTRLLVLLAVIVVALVAVYIWVVPILGDKMAEQFSKEREISMGEQMYKSITASYKIDQQKTATLNKFYQQLQYKTDYPIQITVVESGEMNAFAIPGGHIVVYDAILDRMKTPEELAALLGHEVSHVALRHSLRNIFRSLSRSMFLALITGNQSDIMSVVINNADQLKGLEYSRSLETEADDNGLRLMTISHINTQGMLWLMELLKKESNSAEPPALLSTHPIFTERIEHIRAQLKTLPDNQTQNPQLKELFHQIYE